MPNGEERIKLTLRIRRHHRRSRAAGRRPCVCVVSVSIGVARARIGLRSKRSRGPMADAEETSGKPMRLGRSVRPSADKIAFERRARGADQAPCGKPGVSTGT